LISICETPRDQAAADQQAIPACGGRLRPRRFFHCDGSGPGPPGWWLGLRRVRTRPRV